ncbi:MAG: sulfatase-like hydrolase/transferase [Lachnospiraceae bacterium]|nr:sulfatase-like hydrolase/transferase [Lachnospiraceae bacterium]
MRKNKKKNTNELNSEFVKETQETLQDEILETEETEESSEDDFDIVISDDEFKNDDKVSDIEEDSDSEGDFEEDSDASHDESAQEKDLEEKPKAKINIVKSLIAGVEKFVLFSLLLLYLESVFHVWTFLGVESAFFVKLAMCLPTAAFLSLFCCFFKPTVNKVICWVETGIIMVYYVVNIVYKSIFKVFLSTAFINKNNVKVAQYYRETLEGLKDNWYMLILVIVIPAAVLIVLNRLMVYRYKRVALRHFFVPITILACTIVIEGFLINAMGQGENSPYALCVGENEVEASFEKLGVLATAEVEIKNRLFPDSIHEDEDELSDVWVYNPEDSLQQIGENTDGSGGEGEDVIDENGNLPEGNAEPEVPDEPEPEPEPEIDRSPNMFDIDFVSLAENEPNEMVAGIHNYMSTLVPTNKNEYTGMFKGYNLIFLTAEGFSSIAVDEELTPTLYKLTHEGFVFTNFYNPRTGGSTSDGEFVCNTSLYPMLGGATNFKTVGQNAMPFSIGNYFNRDYGITSRAYHNNDFQYYGRDISYPSMGYYYQGVGNGLEIEKHWPASDKQMFEATLPEYVDDDIFMVYYMTVSGHLNYNFAGNWCSKQHREEVQDLELSEPCQAYLACQMELDRGLESLINTLEEKGIADRTVICFTGDHWPYGLENEEFSELLGHDVEETFELYKSNLILWSASIEEPIVIDKACCSMDIQPTLLNLFGFDFDSRLYMGQDILSDNEGYAPMWDRSIVTDTLMYDRKADTVLYFDENRELTEEAPEGLPEDYLENLKKKLNAKRKYSERIMIYDYYKYIADYLGIEYAPVEQNYIPDYSRFQKKQG